VWDLDSEQAGPEQTLPSSYDYADDPGGRYLAMSNRLIDLEHEDRELWGHNVELDPRGRFVALLHETEETVEIRALPSNELRAELPHGALGAAFSPDGTHIATSGWDGTLRVWELASTTEVARMDHPDKLFSPTFSADGRHLAASCGDGWAWLWLWRPADVAAQARERAGRGLTAEERATYLPE
jgi:WD40 repeat protein